MADEIPLGLKYYLLILTPSLIAELDEFGVQWAAQHPELDPHDIEKAFFTARSIQRRFTDDPEHAPPQLWRDIMLAIHDMRRVLDVLEKETFDAVTAEALKATSELARVDIQKVFEQKREKGEIDFRLHGLSLTTAPEDGQDPAVKEAFHIKRSKRYGSLMQFDDRILNRSEQTIVRDAKSLARKIADEGEESARLDALLVMGAVVIEMANVRLKTTIPDVIQEKFHRMTTKAVMALGALVYRDQYQQLKNALALEPLDSDL
ncbi:MAG: hypothetical protein WD623_02115 [Marinobacter sp.]|uniref:hypothetical protein n=1 Tax=Marinobacter sp. TaxID=50741 RepID=UPI00349FEF85